MKKKRGRKRGEFCTGRYGEVHRLTEQVRRYKVYQPKDGGPPHILSNGCGACNSIGNKLRKCGMRP